MTEHWEAIIVGGGAAGLSAALTLGRARRRVLVVDSGEPRNRFASHMHGVLGHEGLDPADLLRRGRDEVREYGATFRSDVVVGVDDGEAGLTVHLVGGQTMLAKALMVASGMTDVLPDVPGLAEHWGTRVLHCPYCHGWEVRDQRLGVLGTSAISTHQAELVRQWSPRLTFFTAACGELEPEVRRRFQARDVELVDIAVEAVLHDAAGRFAGVRLADGSEVALDALFTAPNPRPHDNFLAGLDLDYTENPMGSFIATDPTGQTSHPRVWAIGNVVNPGANVPMSIGAGSLTAGVVNMALVTEEYDEALACQARPPAPVDHWESMYAGDRRWSGRVNATMADVARSLPVGDALDLGCGEGGDALWLAEQGWRVTAVDISPTAIARAAQAEVETGHGSPVTWVATDLATWTTGETFDLVTASFFHSQVALPRTDILRRAARRIRPGGHLLLVSHVFETEQDIPPWAAHSHSEHDDSEEQILMAPHEEVAELDLDPGQWEVVLQEVRSREATGPDGEQKATVKDGVVLWRRRAGDPRWHRRSHAAQGAPPLE